MDAAWSVSDDGSADELISLRWENEAWTAHGVLRHVDVEYVVRLSPLWQVRQLMLFRDLPEPDLWLGTDGHGRWGEVNGAHRPELDGALDVVVADAAFAHTMPIRRMPIEVGGGATLLVLTIDVETLAVEPQVRRYARLDDRRWRVEIGVDPAPAFEFETDQFGLAADLDQRRRVG